MGWEAMVPQPGISFGNFLTWGLSTANSDPSLRKPCPSTISVNPHPYPLLSVFVV